MNRTDAEPMEGVGSSTDSQLVAAMREYQDAVDAGQRPDRRAFLARHPAVADELAECLDGLHALNGMLPPPIEAEAAGVPIGDFRIVREIGRGGMGIVYEAEQLSLSRRVALKVLPFASTLDPRQLQRFRNEATAAAHLHHPNIVQVYGVGCDRGVHYYAMQFINGRTLADVVRQLNSESLADLPSSGQRDDTHRSLATPPADRDWDLGFRTWDHTPRGPRPTSEYFRVVARWMAQAADGLEHAHQLGVIHRDIKPANLLLDGDGRVCIADFGLAHVNDSDALTHTGDVIGTMRYMCPEQARGERGSDPRGDVYSLGVTLYELLTLQSPFTAREREPLRQQILSEEPRSALQLQPTLPAELGVIVHKAMSKSASERYASAAAMADDLRAWLDDRPIRGRPPTVLQRAGKWARRHRAVVATAAVVLVLATITLGIATAAIAAKHRQVQSALGERDEALTVLSDRQRKTDDALRAESEAKAALNQTLEREQQSAYSYRLPLAQQAIRDGDTVQAHRLLADCPTSLRGWEWHFLEQRLSAPGQALRHATSNVGSTSVRISPDGQTVFAVAKAKASLPARIEAWDFASGKPGPSFAVPIEAGAEIQLSPDATQCAAYHRASQGNTPANNRVTFLNAATGDLLRSWTASVDGISAIRWRPDGRSIAVAGTDGRVTLHDCADGRETKTLRRSDGRAIEIAWNADGSKLAAVSPPVDPLALGREDHAELSAEVSLFDVEKDAVQWTANVPILPPFPFRLPRLSFGPDGRCLMIPTGATTPPRVLNAGSGDVITLPTDAAVVAFTPDGKSALGVQSTGIGVLFELDSQQTLATFRFREPKRIKAGSFELNRARSAAAFTGDGKRLAFAHDDGRISVWNSATGHEICTLPGVSKATSLQFSGDGQHLAAAALDGSVIRWNLTDAPESRTIATAEATAALSSLAVSPDGSTLAAVRSPAGLHADGPASIVLWDLPSGRVRQTTPAPVLGVGWAMAGSGELQFSADGKFLCATGVVRDGPPFGWHWRAVAVWDTETLTAQVAERERLTIRGSLSMHLAEPLVPSTELDFFRVRYRSDQRFIQLLVRGRCVEQPAHSPAMELTHWDDSDRPWSPPNGETIRSASLSRDGRRCIVTRSGMNGDRPLPAIEVWDVADRRLLWQAASQTAARRLAATFSPDGRRIMTQPIQPAIQPDEVWTHRAAIWDAETGTVLCHFSPPIISGPYGERLKSRFVFSHDGQRLASFGVTNGIKIWDANTGHCLLSIGESAGIVSEAVFTAGGLLIARDEHGAMQCWDGRGQRKPPNLDAIVRSIP